MKNNKPEYQELSLSSGRIVRMRPRTYREWEDQEESRLKAVEDMNAMADPDARGLVMQRVSLSIRNARLDRWVENFAIEKESLSLREVEEIERIALDCEKEEIPLGNSETGSAGL